MAFLDELKRRNVVRVGIAYCVFAWMLAQVADFAFDNFGAPDWALKTVVVVLLLGLPLALFFAWVFELTPDGLRREEDVAPTASAEAPTGQSNAQPAAHASGRLLNRFIIVALAVSLAYFVWERQSGAPEADTADSAAGQDAGESDAAGARERSIAVLPFLSLSADKEQQYFSDGLTEEILNALARTPDLLVASRTSSFQYRDPGGDIKAIAEALDVEHILEGSVRRDADRLRVTAQLIRAEDGFHLWSQNYDRKPDDVIAIQEDLATEIAMAMETAMDPEALAEMVSAGTDSIKAYTVYLEALGYARQTYTTGDVEQWPKELAALERAIELDPEFARAHWIVALHLRSRLASTNMITQNAWSDHAMGRDEIVRRVSAAIDNAVRYERDAVSKLKYKVVGEQVNLRLTKALQLNTQYQKQRPNDIGAQERQLTLYADLGMLEELKQEIAALTQRERTTFGQELFAMSYSLIINDPEFIRSTALAMLQRDPDSPFHLYQAHRSLLWVGDLEAARPLQRRVSLSDLPETSRLLSALRHACAEEKQGEAIAIYGKLQRLLQSESSSGLSTLWLAHKIMGEDQAALEALKPMDDAGEILFMVDFVSYAQFDPRPFPNLMRWLKDMDVEPMAPLPVPYACKA